MSRTAESTIRTKELIADALLELMKVQPFEKIKIDDITEKAGVGRVTYFRNFKSKEEIITYKFIRMWERYCDEHELVERRRFNIDNSHAFFEYNLSIRETLEIVYKAGVQNAIFESFFAIMLPPETEDVKKWYREKFYSYGLFGLLDGWVRGGFKETVDEMSDMLISIVDTLD